MVTQILCENRLSGGSPTFEVPPRATEDANHNLCGLPPNKNPDRPTSAKSPDAPSLYMRYTCDYATSMTRMIQIRNVPQQLHATLKSRAALAGQSLSDYLLAELRRVGSRPTPEEMLARLATREPVRLEQSTVRALRAERDSR